jgi:hypothetical protein
MTTKFDISIPMPSDTVPPPRAIFRSRYGFKDRVVIDGDASLVGYVTAMLWRDPDGGAIEVSWIHNGTAQSAWIQPYRLTLADGQA